MANEPKTTGASFDKLKQAFEISDETIEKRMGIKEKIPMPTPKGNPVTVRLLWSKDDAGQPIAVMEKHNPKFRDGTAYFMTAELLDKKGEKQLGLSASLFMGMSAAAKERGIAFEELIGKVGDISATYYTAAPRSKRRDQCTECSGKGCQHCTVTGSGQDAGIRTGLEPPTVYNFTLRDDLMKAAPGKNIGTQF